YAFTAADNGVRTFPVTLKTVGDQSLTITDTVNGTITGSRGTFTEFPIPTPTFLEFVTPGPDGNLWFGEVVGKIGRITPAGTLTEFPVGASPDQPEEITPGPDGNLWFSEVFGNKIGRITPSGAITEFPVPTPNAQPEWITTGPDGNVWFVENTTGKV